MAVTLVFLGRLAEIAGESERHVAAPLDWPGLLAALDGDLAAVVAGSTVKLALDGELLADKTSLRAADGAEIALLPPVSGG